MAEEGFWERYRKFFRKRQEADGFEFHNPPPKSVPPPMVTFREALRWWSWDRRERRRKIREERDRRVQDILELKDKNPPSA